jgi:parallel beta-helix repeat protein
MFELAIVLVFVIFLWIKWNMAHPEQNQTENIKYNTLVKDTGYITYDDVIAKSENILERYRMPSLERMNEEDAEKYVSDIQVLKRITKMGYTQDDFVTPDVQLEQIYQEIEENINNIQNNKEVVRVNFEGNSASQLNRFLEEKCAVVDSAATVLEIQLLNRELCMDAVVKLPSGVILDGQHTVCVEDRGNTEYGFLIEDAENVILQNLQISGACGVGIAVINSSNVSIRECRISGAEYKGLYIIGTGSYIQIINNDVYNNGDGGIYCYGDISNSIIENNRIYNNNNFQGAKAALEFAITGMEDNQLQKLYDVLEASNHIVVRDNNICNNEMNGIYSQGGYLNCYINNNINHNQGDGVIFAYGSFGNYLNTNIIADNSTGMEKDGIEAASGVVLDNTAYNIIYDNIIKENEKSGIRFVRSGCRNLILCNQITDNNQAEDEEQPGYGIELQCLKPEEKDIQDTRPEYENIIARNLISGAHYSAIYFADNTYCNDLIDNMIMDCQNYAVESYTEFFNSSVGNNANMISYNYSLN